MSNDRKEFQFTLRDSIVDTKIHPPSINVFPLHIISGFDNLLKSETRPIILLTYDLQNPNSVLNDLRKKMKYFQIRSKKILKTSISHLTKNSQDVSTDTDFARLVTNGSKLILILNETTYLDVLSSEEVRTKFRTIDLETVFLNERIDQLNQGLPAICLERQFISGDVFHNLHNYDRFVKKILKSRNPFDIIRLGLDDFNILFYSINHQRARLFIYDEALSEKGLVLKVRLKVGDKDAKLVKIDDLFRKIILYYDNGQEYEIALDDLQSEINRIKRLILEDGGSVKGIGGPGSRDVVSERQSRGQRILEYKEKIKKLTEQLKELEGDQDRKCEVRVLRKRNKVEMKNE